jgi:hypothetical protein
MRIIAKLKRAFAARENGRKPRQPRRARPRLEGLEERWCPSYTWTDLSGDHKWSTDTNWKDSTTGNPATSPPSSSTDVSFNGTVSNDDCSIDANATCRTMSSTGAYSGDVQIGNATLTITGSASSTWNTGKIDSGNNNAKIDLNGGTFTYSGGTDFNGANTNTLDVFIEGAGTFKWNSNNLKANAAFDVGRTPAGVDASGAMEMEMNGDPLRVTVWTHGIFTVDANEGVFLQGTNNFTSYGTVTLNTSGVLDTRLSGANGNVSILGGTFDMEDGGTIRSNNAVTFDNAKLELGSSSTAYGTANIQADVVFKDHALLQANVNESTASTCSSLAVTGNCDVNADSTTTFAAETSGTGTPGQAHDYAIIQVSGTGKSLSHQFTNYQWLGNLFNWTPGYTGTKFHLTGTT